MQNRIRPEVTASDLVVGVVGCGVMGRGIAQIAALAGAHVRLSDSRHGASAAAREELRATFTKRVEKGKLVQSKAAAASERLQACDALEQLAGCHLIVEAIVEDLTAKKDLFNKLEGIVNPSAILASNTSSLS